MKRMVRIPLIGAAVLLLLVLAGLGAAAVFVAPNDFKPEIESLVRGATGKTLVLQGDLSLSLFPRLGVEAGPAILRDDDSFGPEPFARVEKIGASAEIVPLLSGKTEISAVTVSGLRLKLAVNEKGQANWAMPEKPASRPAPGARPAGSSSGSPGLAAMALDSLAIHDTVVTYTDMRTGNSARFAVSECLVDSLRVGRKTSLSLNAAYTAAMAAPIKLGMKAEFTLPPTLAQGLSFTTSGMLDDTSFACAGTFAAPETKDGRLLSLKGEMEVGDIDIDRYTTAFATPETPPAPESAKSKASAPAPSADAAAAGLPRTLSLDLRVAAQSVKAANVPITDIRSTIKADRGVLTADPVTMTVAGGPLRLAASLDGRGKSIRCRVTGDWKQAKLGELIRAVTGKSRMSGVLQASWNLDATGISWPEASQTLGGRVTAAISNGTLPGFPLIPAGVPGLPAKKLDLTNVRASGTWDIAKGVARNNDLSVKAAGLEAAGTGRVDIPRRTLHYAVSVNLPTLPELPDLTVLPVVVSGPLASPSYGIDQPALLRETARTLLDTTTKTGRGARKAGEELEKTLGRLFGK